MGAGLSKAPFDEQGFAFAAQLPDAPKALGAQARTCFFKGVIQEARIVAVRGKDDAATHVAPKTEYVPRGVKPVDVATRHAAGINLQERTTGAYIFQCLPLCAAHEGAGGVVEGAAIVEVFDDVEMAEDGGRTSRARAPRCRK